MASLPKNTFVRYNQFREDEAGNFTRFVDVDQRKLVTFEYVNVDCFFLRLYNPVFTYACLLIEVKLLVKVILGRSGRCDSNNPVGSTQTIIVIQFVQFTNNADVGLNNGGKSVRVSSCSEPANEHRRVENIAVQAGCPDS